ncbi:MAG: AAA family ATPase, partial [Acidimicrobiia bacterium]|nr:AAA family ATPase [Acidimicrobiia bacterium]
MLEELVARNLGIIADARIDPSAGFTVITGETGAGKTLLLGAIRLLLGGTAPPELVGPWGDDATAEGRFVTEAGAEIGAARRLSKTGRSRAYIDGSIASAAALDTATDGLIEIIGQHDQLRITRPAEARRLVDRLLTEPGEKAVEGYRRAWETHRQLETDREALGGDRTGLERELGLARHQLGEIAAAQILPGEDRDLEDALSRLRNLSALREHADATVQAIEEAREHAGTAVAEVRRAVRLDPQLAGLVGLLEALESQLGDVALESLTYREALDLDDASLERAETRSRLLADLKRRYGPGLE